MQDLRSTQPCLLYGISGSMFLNDTTVGDFTMQHTRWWILALMAVALVTASACDADEPGNDPPERG